VFAGIGQVMILVLQHLAAADFFDTYRLHGFTQIVRTAPSKAPLSRGVSR
jgi:hypothetical protein